MNVSKTVFMILRPGWYVQCDSRYVQRLVPIILLLV